MSASARERFEKEVKDLHKDNVTRHLAYKPVEVHEEGSARTASGGEDTKPWEVHAIAGEVFVNTHGEKRFTRDELITFRQAIDKAYVTVQ